MRHNNSISCNSRAKNRAGFPFDLEILSGKVIVHLEKSCNFVEFNKNTGKIILDLEKYFIKGKKVVSNCDYN